MKYRKLGSSPLNVSVIGVGGLHFGVFCDKTATKRIIHNASDLGINFIDTAPIYGNGQSEAYVGQAIKGRRDKFLISTKVGLKPVKTKEGTFGVELEPLTPKRIRQSLDKSLSELGIDCIDLYQLHAFDPKTPIEETFGVLNDLIKEGKVRFIGCSNYDFNEYRTVKKITSGNKNPSFVSFQVHYNMIERRAEDEILPACRNDKVGIICNRSLARGILTGKYKHNEPIPEGSRASSSARIKRSLSEDVLKLVSELENYAKERGQSVVEMALAWLLTRKQVSVILAGTRNIDQMEACNRAVEWDLSENDLKRIDEIIDALGLKTMVREKPKTFFER